MLVDRVLGNARVYSPEGLVEAGVAIDKGRIFKIAKETNLPPASEKLDLNGRLVLPGLVDAHVHLRDQQLAYKEDFFSGTAAAAAGGVTTVVDMPNNEPETMSSKALRERMSIARGRAVVNVAFYSAFPRDLGEVCSIVEEGVVGFKLYLSQKVGGVNIEDDESLRQAFEKAGEVKVPVAVHAEDKGTIERRERELRKAGRKDVEAHRQAHSPEAEIKAIQRVLRLAEETHAHAHVCHLSTAAGLTLVLNAKKSGLPVTCEVTPHHLFLSSEHVKRLGNLAVVNPPLRTERDAQALWDALRRGLIDVVATDHAPHALAEKRAASVWAVKPGIVGLETMLPLLLTRVNRGELGLSVLVRATSERPAQLFNLRARGGLVEGNHADLAVVDMKREYKVDASGFCSKARYSPFDGWKVRGKPVKTFVNGELVMDEGEIVAKPGSGWVVR